MTWTPTPDLIQFARESPIGWLKLCTRGGFKFYRHVRYWNRAVMDGLFGDHDVLLEGPPRHTKSMYTTRGLCGWHLGAMPDRNVLAASYALALPKRHGRQIRADLEAWGPTVFGVAVSPRSSAANEFELVEAGSGARTVHGGAYHGAKHHDGGFFGIGVGGGLVGRGFHLGVTDDLLKDKEAARSDTIRENTNEWVLAVFENRREPGGKHIGVQTRWHEMDPHGAFVAAFPKRYVVVKTPAIAEDDDPIGRKPGEALCPDRYPLARLLELKGGMAPMDWNALFQQAPAPPEGNIWKAKWFRQRWWWDPDQDGILRFSDGTRCPLSACHVWAVTDLAHSEKTSADFVVIGTLAHTTDGKLVFLDLVRDRLGDDVLPESHRLWKQHGWTMQFVENTGNQAFVGTMRRSGLPIRTIGRAEDDDLTLVGDKVVVAYAATPTARNGAVWLPKGAHWLPDFEREIRNFPNAPNDDQEDVLAWACLLHEKLITVGGDPVVGAGLRDKYEDEDEDAPAGKWEGLGTSGRARWD